MVPLTTVLPVVLVTFGLLIGPLDMVLVRKVRDAGREAFEELGAPKNVFDFSARTQLKFVVFVLRMRYLRLENPAITRLGHVVFVVTVAWIILLVATVFVLLFTPLIGVVGVPVPFI